MKFNETHPQHPITSQQYAELVKSLTGRSDAVVSNRVKLIPIPALANWALRDRAIELVHKMRDFDESWQTTEMQRVEKERESEPTGDQTLEFHRRTAALESAYKEREGTFKQVYLGEALALRDEMVKRYIRLGVVPPRPSSPIGAFDYGSLAGPDPIGEAATYLERLARELPDK